MKFQPRLNHIAIVLLLEGNWVKFANLLEFLNETLMVGAKISN